MSRPTHELITPGMVLREGLRIQQFIADVPVDWLLDLHTEDCIRWVPHPGMLSGWDAWIILQLSWGTELSGRTIAPFFWKLDKVYPPGEHPERVADRLYRQGPADTAQEAVEKVVAAIRELEAPREHP